MRKSLKFILYLISADIIIISLSFLCGITGVFSTKDKSDNTTLQSDKSTEKNSSDNNMEESSEDFEKHTKSVENTDTEKTSDNHFIVINSTSTVYMRNEASTNGKVICELPANTYGDILDTKGSWTKISYNNKTGYVFSEYIITGASAEELIKQLNSSKVIINKSCNVRNVPDTNSPVIGSAVSGTIYPYIVSQSDEQWYAIIMPDGSTAYISTGYASITE